MKTNREEKAVVRFSKVDLFTSPYKHVRVGEVFEPDVADKLLEFAESIEDFAPKQETFYRNSVYYLKESIIPENLKSLFSRESVDTMKLRAEEIFGINFEDDYMFAIQRYDKGQGTLIHTDWLDKKSRDKYFYTHRFIIYLNHGWTKANGGVFGVFGSPNPKDIVRVVEPLHNTAVGIAHCRHSFHAVSEVTEGRRFALQFYLRWVEGKYETE